MKKSETSKCVLNGFQGWIASALSLRRQVGGQDATLPPPLDISNYDFILLWAGNLKSCVPVPTLC